MTSIALFAGVAIVGRISSYEGRVLLESILPTTRFFTAGVMASGTTVLALMLTLLGLTYATEWTFRDLHYRRISQISMLSSVSIVVSIVTLVFLGLPVEEAEGLRLYYNVIYYAVTGSASVLGGLMVAVVLMLHRTISGLVAIGNPTAESNLIEAETDSHNDDSPSE